MRISQLEEKKENWNTLSYDELLDGKYASEFCDVLDEVKRCIHKDGMEKTFEELKEYIYDNDELIEDIRSVMNSLLTPYNSFKVLRDKIEKNELSCIQVKNIFEEIFEKNILRFDKSVEFIDKEYGLSSNQIEQIAGSMNSIVYKGIEGHFSKKCLKEFFEELTKLDGIYSEIFSELYNNNYKELQINYLIRLLSRETND